MEAAFNSRRLWDQGRGSKNLPLLICTQEFVWKVNFKKSNTNRIIISFTANGCKILAGSLPYLLGNECELDFFREQHGTEPYIKLPCSLAGPVFFPQLTEQSLHVTHACIWGELILTWLLVSLPGFLGHGTAEHKLGRITCTIITTTTYYYYCFAL